MARSVKNKRKFDGEYYYLHAEPEKKKTAEQLKERIKQSNYKSRITKRKNGYSVWASRTKSK